MAESTRLERQLWNGFTGPCEGFPEKPAINVGHEVTYQELARRAKRIAATVQIGVAADAVPLTSVFVYRSETAYAAVLGALLAGHGYVPLNRTFPADQTWLMLERSMCGSISVDARSEPQFDVVLATGIEVPWLLLCPGRLDMNELTVRFPRHQKRSWPYMVPRNIRLLPFSRG